MNHFAPNNLWSSPSPSLQKAIEFLIDKCYDYKFVIPLPIIIIIIITIKWKLKAQINRKNVTNAPR